METSTQCWHRKGHFGEGIRATPENESGSGHKKATSRQLLMKPVNLRYFVNGSFYGQQGFHLCIHIEIVKRRRIVNEYQHSLNENAKQYSK